MNYQACIIDHERGHHRIGVGSTPVKAILQAWRAILTFEVPSGETEQLNKLGPTEVMQAFRMSRMEDVDMAETLTVKEDVNDTLMLVRFDRAHENLYLPVGWVRPIF